VGTPARDDTKSGRWIPPPAMDGVLAIITVSLVALIVGTYVSREHTLYWSDYSGYQEITNNLVDEYRESIRVGLGAVWHSMGSDYNALFTIPLVPVALFLGRSRLVFEESLALAYLVPFILSMGLVATELVSAPRRPVFWSTVIASLLTPMVWLPTLRGYPDSGGAALMALAVWIYVRDVRLRLWWQAPAIGFLLASAMLFRRHFAYAVTAFLAATAICLIARYMRPIMLGERRILGELGSELRHLAIEALSITLVLLGIGHAFVARVLATDYSALYASYLDDPMTVLLWYPSTYGWLTTSAAVLGFLIAWKNGLLRRDAAWFLMIFGIVEYLQWAFVVRQLGEQYTLHFVPWVILGLVSGGWALHVVSSVWTKLVALAAALCLCTLNLLAGFASTDVVPRPATILLTKQEAPLQRTDYPDVVRLITRLRHLSPGTPIYIAASSQVLNSSLVRNGERAIFGWNRARLNILDAPQIDSRDPYPLEDLLRARIVVIVEPVQHQLDARKQRVVSMVVHMFAGKQGLARDFLRLPERYRLEDHAQAVVFARMQPTGLVMALDSLRAMRRSLPEPSAAQPAWILLDPGRGASRTVAQGGSYTLESAQSTCSRRRGPTWVYLPTVSARARIAANVYIDRASRVLAQVWSVTPEGRVRRTAEQVRANGGSLSLPVDGYRQVLVHITSLSSAASDRSCHIRLEHLAIRTP
jgi:hypothetical protein